MLERALARLAHGPQLVALELRSAQLLDRLPELRDEILGTLLLLLHELGVARVRGARTRQRRLVLAQLPIEAFFRRAQLLQLRGGRVAFRLQLRVVGLELRLLRGQLLNHGLEPRAAAVVAGLLRHRRCRSEGE